MAKPCSYTMTTPEGEEKNLKDSEALHKYLLSDKVNPEDIFSQIKSIQDATPSSKIENQEGNQQAGVEEHRRTGASRNEETESQADRSNSGSDGTGPGKEKEVGPDDHARFRMEDTEAERKALGIEGHPVRGKSDAELQEEADKAIDEGYNIPKLAEDILSGKKTAISDTERVILTKYAASQQAKVDVDPSDENITNYANTIKALDRAGSEAGAALRAIQLGAVKEATLADAYFREMDSRGVDTLSPEEKEIIAKEWNDIQDAGRVAKEEYARVVAENDRLKAEAVLKKERGSTKRQPRKTHDDFVKERKSILEDLKQSLKEVNKGQASATIVPGATQLIAIAPHVMKLTRSLLEEGVNNLGDVVKNIHEQLKDVVEEISEKDIHNIIAGDYADQTRKQSQINREMRDLRSQADLINKLEKLEKGEVPTSAKAKIQRSREVEALRKQLKEKLQTNDTVRLEAHKKALQKRIDALQNDLDTGNFLKDRKPEPPLKRDKAAQDVYNKYLELKAEREKRLAQQEYDKRSKAKKIGDNIIQIATIPRALKTAIDFAAVLKHGVVATFSHPIRGVQGVREMFAHAFSEKTAKAWMNDVKESPDYETMRKSGLRISDPDSYKLTAREEAFTSHILEKIPGLGKFFKANERAYTGYLNYMRVNLFRDAAYMLHAKGIDPDNEPKVYTDLAQFVNNSTGTGTGGEKFEKAVPLLNTIFFSPRMIAARLNLMNPIYYAKLSPELRGMAIGDVAKYVSTTLGIVGAAYAAGARVSLNPQNPDFLKMRFGDKRYNVLGGFDSYIKAVAQSLAGGKHDTETGKFKKVNGLNTGVNFTRGKLSPSAGIVVDVVSGKDFKGQKVTLKSELLNQLPFAIDEYLEKEHHENPGIETMDAALSMFGVDVQDYQPKPKKGSLSW